MLNKLIQEYINKFNSVDLALIVDLEEKEQIKILIECLNENKRIYECDYYNNNYMEYVL